MQLKTYAENSLAHLNFDHLLPNVAALLRICKPVSGIVPQQLNIISPDSLGNWDWQKLRA